MIQGKQDFQLSRSFGLSRITFCQFGLFELNFLKSERQARSCYFVLSRIFSRFIKGFSESAIYVECHLICKLILVSCDLMITLKKKNFQVDDTRSWKPRRTPTKSITSSSSKNLLKENYDVNNAPQKITGPPKHNEISNDKKESTQHSEQIMCRNHSNKPAAFEGYFDDAPEFYCERCAVGLAAQGHRLIQLNMKLHSLKEKLSAALEKEMNKVRNSYKFVISTLQTELQNLQKMITQKYEQAIHLSSKVQTCPIITFKPGQISSVTLSRIKQAIGKIQFSQISTSIQAKSPYRPRISNIPAVTETTTISNTSNLSGRTRQDSNRSSRPKPTQIFIELCDDQVTFSRAQHRLSTHHRQLQNILM